MSKHETANQFKDGLMMDVHPLQAANSVLTDCLNGTFITYNGNEHVLQNDMGNFKLNKCKLKENYIPIGTASYGDILYIASYNPIDKMFEIGSYPSPLQWADVSTDKNSQFISILQNALTNAGLDGEGVPTINYSEIERYSTSVVFDEEEYKLLPGDKYKLTEENLGGPKIEAFEYFVLDENNVKHDITDDVEINGTEPIPVSWQIPGYFGTTSSILTPKTHKMSLMSATTGPKTVRYNLRSIVSIYDDRLLKPDVLELFSKNLSFEATVLIDGSLCKTFTITSDSEAIGNNPIYESKTVQWLYDKKQIIYNYTIDVNYEEANKPLNDNGVFYERLTEIYCIPVLNYIADGIEEGVNGIQKFNLRYDTLRSSVTYTANGKNKNTVAVDTFAWSISEAEYEDGEETKTRSELEVTYDLFTASEDVNLFIFCTPVENLFDRFDIPSENIVSEENVCYINIGECGVVKQGDVVKFLNFAENTLYVVFFAFGSGETIPDDAKFTARFLYTGKESEFDGRADVKLNLQEELDEYLSEIKATNAKYTLSNITSTFKGNMRLFTTDPDVFTLSSISGTSVTQNIVCDSNLSISGNGDSMLIDVVDNDRLPNFMQQTLIDRKYSTSGEVNTYSSDTDKQFKYELIVPITGTKSAKSYYDFSQVKGFKTLNANDVEVYDVYWITRENRAQLARTNEWLNDDTITFLDSAERYTKIDQSHNHNIKTSKVFKTTAKEQFNIVNVGVKRHGGGSDYALMLYNAANARYLQSDSKGEILSRTFLQVGYGSDWCFIQFDTNGNDSETSLKDIISRFGYFTFNSNVSGQSWSTKNIYTYKMSIPTVAEQKHTLYEKVAYGVNNNHKRIFDWVKNGSNVNVLACSSKCEFDPDSAIEKLKFNEIVGNSLTVTFDSDMLQEHISNEIEKWNQKWKNAADTKNPDPNNYTKYITNSGHEIKDRLYLLNRGEDSKYKNFAKNITPNRELSRYPLATLDGNYSSAERASFYFGNVSSGKTRRQIGYIDGFVQWLPKT